MAKQKTEEEKLQEAIRKNKALLKRYPILTPYLDEEGLAKYDYSYTMLDFIHYGWRKLFLEVCDAIMAHLKEVGVDQSQFRFFRVGDGGGALSMDSALYGDAVIEDILYEDGYVRSLLYCPICGAETKYVVTANGRRNYVCDGCVKKGLPDGAECIRLTKQDVPIIRERDYETGKTVERKTKYDSDFMRVWGGEEA